jgi:transposase
MLGRSLQNFSRGRRSGRRVGFPRFRAKGRCHEAVIFQRPRIGDARHVELDGRLGPVRSREKLSKLMRLLERDEHARILRATVSRSAAGRWFISFTVRRAPKQRRARKPNAAVGVDVGLRRLATLSTGDIVENHRHLQGFLRRLRRLQRQLDRQRRANNPDNYRPDGTVRPGRRGWRSSARMRRTEERIRRLHARIANLRREDTHQLTTMLVRDYAVIGVETLTVKGMLQDGKLARHIADVCWGELLRQLDYKTSWSEGSVLIAADRFYPSSKTCSACGTVRAKLGRGESVFVCEEQRCRLVMDRDENAARNLALMALRFLQAEGRRTYLAAAGAESRNARRGQVSPVRPNGHSPLKREDPSDGSLGPSQARKSPALASG